MLTSGKHFHSSLIFEGYTRILLQAPLMLHSDILHPRNINIRFGCKYLPILHTTVNLQSVKWGFIRLGPRIWFSLSSELSYTWCQCYKTFYFVTGSGKNKLERFSLLSFFQAHLIFSRKARSFSLNLSTLKVLAWVVSALPANIRLA